MGILFTIVVTYLLLGVAISITGEIYGDKLDAFVGRGTSTLPTEAAEAFEEAAQGKSITKLIFGIVGWPIAVVVLFMFWRRIQKMRALSGFEKEQLGEGIFGGAFGDMDSIERKPFRLIGGALVLDYSDEIDAVHDVFAPMNEDDTKLFDEFIEKVKGAFVDKPGEMMGVHFERNTLEEGSCTFSMKSFKGCGAVMCHFYFRRQVTISSACSYEMERFIEMRASIAKMPEREEDDTLGTFIVNYLPPEMVYDGKRWMGEPIDEDLSGYQVDHALAIRMAIIGKLNEGIPDEPEPEEEAFDGEVV